MERIDEELRFFLDDIQLIGQGLDAHAVHDPVTDLLGLLPLLVRDIGHCLLLPRRGYDAEDVAVAATQNGAQCHISAQMSQYPQFQLTVIRRKQRFPYNAKSIITKAIFFLKFFLFFFFLN